MPRDLDFRRAKPSRRPLAQPTRQAAAVAKGQWPIILLIVGLGLAITGLVYYFNQDLQPTPTPNPTAVDVEQKPNSTVDSSNNVFAENGKLTVQLYESGADPEAVALTIKTLEAKGYGVKNLGASQYEYDKTYISHTTKFAVQAKEIGKVLADRVISYKETQSSGIFDILIYLGKQ